jgi:xanthine dehydrogenase iron-sulfur cluster and FAD-binding subunit A
VGQVEERRVETIESLGLPGKLNALQQSFLEHGGAQCGICTPGMVLTAWAWVRSSGRDDPASIRAQLAGNLCRCTGYQHIVDSVRDTVRAAQKKQTARRHDAAGRAPKAPRRKTARRKTTRRKATRRKATRRKARRRKAGA